MRCSNRYAVDQLLSQGYDHIWLKKHMRKPDRHYSQQGHYYGIDVWNMFDGICIKDGKVVFIAIKTNNWDSSNKINDWLSDKVGVNVISINVKTKNGRKMDVRHYQSDQQVF